MALKRACLYAPADSYLFACDANHVDVGSNTMVPASPRMLQKQQSIINAAPSIVTYNWSKRISTGLQDIENTTHCSSSKIMPSETAFGSLDMNDQAATVVSNGPMRLFNNPYRYKKRPSQTSCNRPFTLQCVASANCVSLARPPTSSSKISKVVVNPYKKRQILDTSREKTAASALIELARSNQCTVDRAGKTPVFVAVDVETHDWKVGRNRASFIGRIVQIGWIAYDENGGVIDEECHIIKPSGFQISKKAEDFHHISTERALREGKDAGTILAKFVNVLKRIPSHGSVIAHNMSHEDCCFKNNLQTKYDLAVWNNVPKCDTVSTDLLRMWKGDRSSSWIPYMKLCHLHELVCGTSTEMDELRANAHSADADAKMAGQIFFKYRSRIPHHLLPWRPQNG